jgi:hypothetical protein
VLPPVIERELRMALLRRKARAQWMSAAWIAGGITFFFVFFFGLTSSPLKGRTLFHLLFGLACLGVASRGFGLTADLFSEERRQGTLGLLVLTGLTPLEIFANKLFGAVLLSSYGLLAGLPFFAMSFLAGGVSGTQFLCALVFLVNALLFCLALGLLASVLHRDGGQAQASAVAAGAILCLAAPLARWIAGSIFGNGTFGQEWMASSPAYAGYQAFSGFVRVSTRLFWESSGISLAYSLTALLVAAVVLQRTGAICRRPARPRAGERGGEYGPGQLRPSEHACARGCCAKIRFRGWSRGIAARSWRRKLSQSRWDWSGWPCG